MPGKVTRTRMKEAAQDALMHGIGAALSADKDSGFYPEDFEQWTSREQEAYREVLKKQADRVAKLFGFDEAWFI
ncbi:hypothetical protein [Streptomyces sp. Tu6071]|uniref:hypothetical protein n=1 Tax=Streptomyces sp. Tu6071 TaxID=355249 RepID=UPI00131A0F0B|nr:hypothetical protein [Streptomyces sp. Tu6071]